MALSQECEAITSLSIFSFSTHGGFMSRLILRTSLTALSLAIVFSGGISEAKGPGSGKKGPHVRASAKIQGCGNFTDITGTVKLREEKTSEGVKEVRVKMKVKGLPPGNHAVHIHETADCVPCGDAAGHFDPGPNGNSSPDGNHPFHSGDLINIKVKKSGKGNAKLITRTTRVTLSPGPLSLFDTDGSAFIIHEDPDTYCPNGAQGGCAGGARIACGVIK
jgi:Cu-Zn family superoxide dismutase